MTDTTEKTLETAVDHQIKWRTAERELEDAQCDLALLRTLIDCSLDIDPRDGDEEYAKLSNLLYSAMRILTTKRPE